MRKKGESLQIQVPMSRTEKKNFEMLAEMLDMTCSGLGAMMICDTINSNITKILEQRPQKVRRPKTKITGHSPYNKSECICIRMSRQYVEQLDDALKNHTDTYNYSLTQIAQFCIKYQLKNFSAFMERENSENGKEKLERYVVKKSKWCGIPIKQFKNYYLGKQVNKIITEVENEREIWNM